jgi:hypothetical protein
MRSQSLWLLGFVMAGTVTATGEPPALAQPAAQAAPATTQPAKVISTHSGRQVFKSTNSAGTAVKPGMATPTATVTLKPGEVPGIKFDTPIYDFGHIRAGSDVEHDYWFTNTGSGPLEILAVRPG